MTSTTLINKADQLKLHATTGQRRGLAQWTDAIHWLWNFLLGLQLTAVLPELKRERHDPWLNAAPSRRHDEAGIVGSNLQ